MAYVAKRYGSGRRIWLFDSFEGLPKPTLRDGPDAVTFAAGHASGRLQSINQLTATTAHVEEVLARLDIDRGAVEIRKGWFQQTIPGISDEIGPIALLRLDGDWYESTMIPLESLYDAVTPGGYVIIDDYEDWQGCRVAVDDFLSRHSIHAELLPVDTRHGGRYFQKP